MAKMERQVHMSLYPDWTAKDNYARKRKTKIKKDKLEVVESKMKVDFKRRMVEDREG